MRCLTCCSLFAVLFLASCAPVADVPALAPAAYDPFLPLEGSPAVLSTGAIGATPAQPTPTEGPFIVPTAIPLERLLPTPRPIGMPIYTPAPDGPRTLPTTRTNVDRYIVQPGDMLGAIAQTYGVGLEALMQANGLTDPNQLEVGQPLVIPVPQPGAAASSSFLRGATTNG